VSALQTPLLALSPEALAVALENFSLPPSDSKPDLFHWLPLLAKVDELLRRCTERSDCQLSGNEESPFPVAATLAALRFTTLLVDGSHNRHLYPSAEVRGCPVRWLCGDLVFPGPRKCRLTRNGAVWRRITRSACTCCSRWTRRACWSTRWAPLRR